MASKGRNRGWGFEDRFHVYAPRTTAGDRLALARKSVAAHGRGRALDPVPRAPRARIAETFWGKAWCENLERYSDYSNRLPRGRSYVRSGSVIDLRIEPGEVRALVQGSSLYEVTVSIDAVEEARWRALVEACAGGIESVIELLSGRLSDAVMAAMTRAGTGLFPEPARVRMKCSCPDWATMCKHVAAVLYGVGARLDRSPELLFHLRRAKPEDLVARATTATVARAAGDGPRKKLGAALDLGDVFGIDLEAPARPASPKEVVVAAPTVPARAPKAKAKAKTTASAPDAKSTTPNAKVKTSAPPPPSKTVRAPRTAQGTIITRAQLLKLGVTTSMVRRWLEEGHLRRTPISGMYERMPGAEEAIVAYLAWSGRA